MKKLLLLFILLTTMMISCSNNTPADNLEEPADYSETPSIFNEVSLEEKFALCVVEEGDAYLTLSLSNFDKNDIIDISYLSDFTTL